MVPYPEDKVCVRGQKVFFYRKLVVTFIHSVDLYNTGQVKEGETRRGDETAKPSLL